MRFLTRTHLSEVISWLVCHDVSSLMNWKMGVKVVPSVRKPRWCSQWYLWHIGSARWSSTLGPFFMLIEIELTRQPFKTLNIDQDESSIAWRKSSSSWMMTSSKPPHLKIYHYIHPHQWFVVLMVVLKRIQGVMLNAECGVNGNQFRSNNFRLRFSQQPFQNHIQSCFKIAH